MPKPRPLPPPPVPGRICVFGGGRVSTGWRWFAAAGAWERVCESHYTAAAQRRGDYVPDDAIVERAESGAERADVGRPEPRRTS